jgi:penicillin-binding protein 2
MVNNQGYRQSESVWEPATPGSNAVLTIDLRIQEAAETALKHGPYGAKTKGAVVVMDVNTGDILALASSPVYDPNFFIDPHNFPSDFNKKAINEAEAEKNRATQ